MTSPRSDFVPDWAKGIVWYQIFPERFWNGDPSNDPRLEDQAGAWPHDLNPPWQVHPWTADWYELQPYERANGKGIWHNLQRRRYGGDLQGILDRLDYLQELGVDGLYLNPVFQAPSSHKYDGATYHHVDPTFGPDPAGDRRLMAAETPHDPATWAWTAADRLLLRLVNEVHRRGMRLILDGVFNHMGVTSWAFTDVRRHQQASPYKDWFTITSWDNSQRGERFSYAGWFGVPELPELRKDEQGIVPGAADYIFAATRRWMDPDDDGDPTDGIDGWRLDVAFCVGHPFWKRWRRHVKAINPQAFLVGELFYTLEDLAGYLQGDELDAAMNYPFAYACAEYFVQETHRIATSTFDRRLAEVRDAFPPCVAEVMQNLFSSHDTNRIGSHIVNRREANMRQWQQYCDWSSAQNNPTYDTRKPTAEERRLHRLFLLFQMTYLGSPMLYYGDEAGMWGANDPCCRKPMVWPELSYAAEKYRPDGSLLPTPDAVAFDHDLFDLTKRLIRLRKNNPALRHGDFEPVLVDDAKEVYAFRRRTGAQTALVALNRSRGPQRISLPAEAATQWTDVLANGQVYQAEDGMLALEVDGLWGCVLVADWPLTAL